MTESSFIALDTHSKNITTFSEVSARMSFSSVHIFLCSLILFTIKPNIFKDLNTYKVIKDLDMFLSLKIYSYVYSGFPSFGNSWENKRDFFGYNLGTT